MEHNGSRGFILAALLLLTASCCPLYHPDVTQRKSFDFAVTGDIPRLGDTEVEAARPPLAPFLRLRDTINQDRRIKFTIHLGDFKTDRYPCSDAVFARWKKLCAGFLAPLVYVVGDNEWTDCHKRASGEYDPQERLEKLRSLFHAEPHALGIRGNTIKFTSQADTTDEADFRQFRENFRWVYDSVMFVALNVQGSNNNYPGTDTHGRRTGNMAEFKLRNRACITFLKKCFSIAQEGGLKGIVIAIQGSPPQFERFPRERGEGFSAFIATLREQTEKFRRPVLLLNGDSHYFRVDRPLRGRRTLHNFTRVECFGLDNDHWVRITVNPAAPGLFTVQAEAVPDTEPPVSGRQ